MMRRTLRQFASTTEASATVDFVVIFLGFIAIMFFVVEVTLYMFFLASIEKAAEAGVRAAVVSPPVADMPLTIAKDSGGIWGRKCSDASAPCIPFTTVSCTGTACLATPFNRILAHMRGFNGRIQAENVTVTYSDAGIGFAGGPSAPMVTVTVADVPFQTGILGLLLANTGNLAELPPRSASMTPEDLAL
jgi:Flp pilus assembly protein TadG